MSADSTAAPVFILGFPRSGTTLLGQILASDPNVCLLEERPLLAAAIADFADAPGGLDTLADLPDAALETYREDFWVQAGAYGFTGGTLIEQTALNTVYLPIIGRLFPAARIVFALRDPRDVVLSCFRRQFAPSRFTLEFRTLESTARFYDAAMILAEACRGRLGFDRFDIRNEDVIADFDAWTRRLCDFCGVTWSETMRDFHHAAEDRLLGTRSAAQIRRGLSAEGIGIWRRYREQMEPVLPLLAPWTEKFGYAET